MACRLLLRAGLSGLFLVGVSGVVAAQDGSSIYLQGTYNDFAMAMIGPPGFYFRNDTFLYDATLGPRPLAGEAEARADQQVWVNTLKLSWVSDWKLLGGTYSAAVAVPYVLDGEISGELTAPGFAAFRTGDVSGLADIFLLPFQLQWTHANHNFNLSPGIAAPTGSYDVDKVLNVGRNYWAFDLAGSYTWLDPKRGHEISISTGILFNGENEDTDYHEGDEFHIDWLLGQHFSESFAVGLTGYWLTQISDDTGTLPDGFEAGKLDSSGYGIGPALLYGTQVGGKHVSFIAKWLHDLDSENRAEGDLFMLSVGMKL